MYAIHEFMSSIFSAVVTLIYFRQAVTAGGSPVFPYQAFGFLEYGVPLSSGILKTPLGVASLAMPARGVSSFFRG
jgi:hypothetical protein